MIKKVFRKLKAIYAKHRDILKTIFNKYSKSSDYQRWSQSKSLLSSWDERSLLLAKQVQPRSVVFEFGAARFILRDALPEGCTYLHSDIVSRNEDTLVVDLNKELPQIPKVDYVIFSGVLEYIFEVQTLLNHLSSFTSHIVFSYATTDAFLETKTRRFHGWVSDLSELDIVDIAKTLHYECEIIGHWKKQTLFHFIK